MQIFVSTTSLGQGQTDLAKILPELLTLNLDGIEFGSTHVWQPDFESLIKQNRPARFLTHNYFPPAPESLVINLTSSDPEVRQASLTHARTCIEFAARLGSELYTVHPGFMTSRATTTTKHDTDSAFDFDFSGNKVSHEMAFTLMCDSLAELLHDAKRAGVRLAIETEGSVTKPGILLMEQPKEYRRLFAELGNELFLNFNLAHSSLAAKFHCFDLNAFIQEFSQRFAAIEISHNNGVQDEHKTLVEGSYVFNCLQFLPDVPLILEFREASLREIKTSAEMLRTRKSL